MLLNTPIVVHSKDFFAAALSGCYQNLWHPFKIKYSFNSKNHFEFSFKNDIFLNANTSVL